MFDLVIHTRYLSVRDPRGTYLSVHSSRCATCPSIIESIAASNASLSNRICSVPWIIYIYCGTRHVPQNCTSFLISYSSSIHITFVTTMSQNQCKWHVHTINEEMTISIIMHNSQQQQQQWINKSFIPFSTHHTPVINHIAFYYPLFIIIIFQYGQVNPLQSFITPQTYHREIHDSIYLTRAGKFTCLK